MKRFIKKYKHAWFLRILNNKGIDYLTQIILWGIEDTEQYHISNLNKHA